VGSIFTDDSQICADDELGISEMMQQRMEIYSDIPFDEDEKKFIIGTIKQQVLERVEAMRPVLSEPQLQQYRTYLETTAAQSMGLYDIGRFSDFE